jgi:sortase A
MNAYRDVALGVECALPQPERRAGAARNPRWMTWIAAPLLLACVIQFGRELVGDAAQRSAQALLEHTWQKTLAGDAGAEPWPWADSKPVAQLAVPSQGVTTLVVAGRPMMDELPAPVHQPGTPLPGHAGNSVITDRDGSALGFVRHLQRGDLLSIERTDRASLAYRVTDIEIIDQRDVWITKNEGPTRLTLITCYPFDAQCAQHSLRYVVIARALPARIATAVR